MKLLSLFSGIGAFEKALDGLDIPYELVGFSEIDKYAVDSYCAIHNVDKSMNLGDITKIDGQALPKDIDLITYGFPCQDISLAGKQKGLFNEDGSQTRSGLFFEALRIIEDTQPKVAIAENVKNLTGKTFKAQFEIVLKSLEEAGYNNYWKVLNAKDYGVPQNRERVFIVSIRKDIDTRRFTFPEGFPLDLRLKDVLEKKVDEKYYLKKTKDWFIQNSFDMESKGNGFRFDPHVLSNADIAKTITTRAGARMDDNYVIDIESESATFKFDKTNPEVIQIANLMPTKTRDNPNQGRLYDTDGISPTLGAMQGGNLQPFVAVEPLALDEQNRYIRKDGCIGTLTTDGSSPKHNNRVIEPLVWDGYNQQVRADSSVVGTLTRQCGADLKRNGQGIIESPYRIRKLTPKECFRLMDFSDEDFDACEKIGMSNAQLYKQAGNSIVVAVPYYIINSLVEAGIFEYEPPYDVYINGKHYLTDEQCQDYISAKEENITESSDNTKPIEYIFNQNKLIDLLLREGVISVKGE